MPSNASEPNGSSSGIDTNDAQVAANIVCEEVRRHPNVAPGRFYKVQVTRLGRSIYLALVSEQPEGTMIDKRQIQLAEIEEVPVVAARLVRSLLENLSLSETATVENIGGAEARTLKKKSGEVLFGLGFLGAMTTKGSFVQPGGVLSLTYESGHIAVPLQLRFGGGEGGNKSGSFVAGDLGFRYAFFDTDISPVVGGGIGLMTLGTRESKSVTSGTSSYATTYESLNKFGLNTYVEAGVEALRTHKFHLLATLRVDAPLFSLEGSRYEPAAGGNSSQSTSISSYVLPVSLGVQAMYRF